MSFKTAFRSLLCGIRNFKKSDAKQDKPKGIKTESEDGIAAWVTSDDASTRCIYGGWHQPGFQWVIDPLSDTKKQQADAEQQSLSVGDAFNFNGKANDGPRCAKCNKQVVPVLDFEPGVRFIAQSTTPSNDSHELSRRDVQSIREFICGKSTS